MTTPTDQILAAALQTETVMDATGRELTLRRLTALDRLRLFKAIGPTLSQNGLYLGMAVLAASVTAIDNVPVPAPINEHQVEALVGRLGDVGIAAVADRLSVAEPTLGSAGLGN